MIYKRIIPVLLLHDNGLVKTVKFTRPKYVGDPINAIKIFNDKEVDELIFLDIDVSKKNMEPNYSLLEDIASECFMPLAYGGGVFSIEQVQRILTIGFEKVIFNTAAISKPTLITEVARSVGSQSVVVSVDVKTNWRGKRVVFSHNGQVVPRETIVEYCLRMQELGAGELFLNSVDRDGAQNGYDLELIQEVSTAISIPVVACGGAGSIQQLYEGINVGKASAVAAGSMFVFHGPHRAVLINYPSEKSIMSEFKDG
jgi:imidazole glycerol-phosphate synthase subunit HisF